MTAQGESIRGMQGGPSYEYPTDSTLPSSFLNYLSAMAAATRQQQMPGFPPQGGFPSPYHYYPFPPPFYAPQQAGWPSPRGGQYVSNPSLYQNNFSGYITQGPALSSSTELVLRGAGPPPESPTPSTSRSLIRIKPTRRDTPAEYPIPPLDDPENPPVPIHPYLYNVDCPVQWDMRTNLRHNAKRSSGEMLSSIALKANAINAAGANHNTMKILFADENYPWSTLR